VAAYPVTLGYEMASEVVEAAPDVAELRVGDLAKRAVASLGTASAASSLREAG